MTTTSAASYMSRLGAAAPYAAGVAGPSPEDPQAADLPARIRRGGPRCAAEGVDHLRYLLRLAELELIDRERRRVERRIRLAKFPTLDSFDFIAIASRYKALVLELARCAYIERGENVIAVGNSGAGKSHIAPGLGLAACQKGLSVGFTSAASLNTETCPGASRAAEFYSATAD